MTSPVPNKGKGKLVQKDAIDEDEDDDEDEEEEEEEDDDDDMEVGYYPTFNSFLRCKSCSTHLSRPIP